MKKILFLLLSSTVLFGGGCNKKVSLTNEPTVSTSPRIVIEEIIPTSTVFTIKDLTARIPIILSYNSKGLSYSRSLTTFNSQKNHLTLLVEPVHKAPINPVIEGDEDIRSQNELKIIQKNLVSNTNKTHSPLISTRYDVPGASFYKQAEWFHNNSVYTLRFSLAEQAPTGTWNAEIQNKIEVIKSSIDHGEITEETKKQLKIFKEIIDSIYFGEKQGFINSVQHSIVSYPHQTLALFF